MKRVLFVVVAVVTLIGLALPAGAHSEEELAEFLESHQRLREHLGGVLYPEGFSADDVDLVLAAVLEDWEGRHPCSKVLGTWEEERCTPRPVVHSHTASSGPAPSRAMGSGVEQWRSLVATYFPAGEVERALCIMSHESGGNPSAKNPRSSAAGLFQFLRGTWDGIVPSSVRGGSYSSGAVYDPVANVAAAAWLVAADGWHHWSPWNRGLCR